MTTILHQYWTYAMALKAGLTTCTMIFRDQDYDSGWTESFQCNIADMNNAMTAIQTVAQDRVTFLSGRFSIEYCRVSLVQAPHAPGGRNQRVAFLRRTDLGGSLDPTGDGDLPFVAALIRFYTADKKVFGLRQFRGIPDAFWGNNDDKNAKARLSQPINKFVQTLIAQAMGMNHKVPGNPPGVALATIASGEYERLTHRITGRPIYLPRGRK